MEKIQQDELVSVLRGTQHRPARYTDANTSVPQRKVLAK
jgi:hypothetical protein